MRTYSTRAKRSFSRTARSLALVLGLTTLSLQGPAEAQEAAANHLVQASRVVPMIMLNPQVTDRRLVFAWSRECTACARLFQKTVWPYFSDPSGKKATAISVIQIASSSGEIDEVIDSACSSPSAYQWYAFKHLLRDAPNSNRISMQAPPEVDSAAARKNRSKLCSNRNEARQVIRGFVEAVKKEGAIKSVPIIMFNDRVLGPPYSIPN